jgi:hypothetical protein
LSIKKSPARILRSKGLIPADWNLRSLTRGQKSYVTKQTKKFASVIRRPDDYVARRAGASTLKQLKAANFPVHNGKALIYTPPGDSVSVAKGKITFTRKRQQERVLLQGAPDFLRALEKLPTKKLPRGQYVGIKIGNSPVIATFHSLADLQHYALAKRQFSEKELATASIVIIDTNRGYENDGEEDEEDED